MGWWLQGAVPKPCAKGLAPGLGTQLIPEGARLKLAPDDRHGAGASGVIIQEPRPHNNGAMAPWLICLTVCAATAPSLTQTHHPRHELGVAADWRDGSQARHPPDSRSPSRGRFETARTFTSLFGRAQTSSEEAAFILGDLHPQGKGRPHPSARPVGSPTVTCRRRGESSTG